MKKILAILLCAMMAVPAITFARDDHHHGRTQHHKHRIYHRHHR